MLSIPKMFDDWLFKYPSEVQTARLDQMKASADIVEDAQGIRVVMDLPGFKKENIAVDLHDNGLLSIQASRDQDEKKEGETWHLSERSQLQITRQFRLPKNIDRDGVVADFQDGVLRLAIPKLAKKEEAPKTRIQLK